RRGAIRTSQGRILALLGRGSYYAGRFTFWYLVQENRQSVLESVTAAYMALGAAGYAVFLLLDSDALETRLYLGVRGDPGKSLGRTAGELLAKNFEGHFGGSLLVNLPGDQVKTLLDKIEHAEQKSITAVTSVPALTTDDRDAFMQGLERFIDAAEGTKYQAMVLAEPVAAHNLNVVRAGYEQVATQLSPLQKRQLSYGEQESDSVGLSLTKGLSDSLGESLGLTTTTGTSSTVTDGTSESTSDKTTGGKVAALGGSLAVAGSAVGMLAGPGGAVFGSAISSAMGSVLSTAFGKTVTTGSSHSTSTGTTESTSESKTTNTTRTISESESQSLNKTQGVTRQFSIEENNKSIERLLTKIDGHLERIDEAQTYGGWNAAAYFVGESVASSESLASIFLGLIRGGKSSHEDFALTTWKKTQDKKEVAKWLANLSHPHLQPNFHASIPVHFLTPATLVSGKEVAILLGLPRHSTSTVSVLEAQPFGRRVQRLELNEKGDIKEVSAPRTLQLGQIRHLWKDTPQVIELDIDQLTSHVFVSGSTGSGKSNTVYTLLDQLHRKGASFMVIEPAKGEYKHVFGSRADVRVLGTNPRESELLRISPFAFPPEIHVLEHIDRLVEIFNVCWPMYAAMPAVLKDAMLQVYEQVGWDLNESANRYGDKLFPTFADLLVTLKKVIDKSAYSQEVKSNYEGSLATRIKSLTNGLNGQIFSAHEIDATALFDSNVIVDLSRIGSAETKSLIMGVLIMRLSEYRMSQGGMNSPLKHVTVLEEAHNILRKSPEGGAEGANVQGKSVEMLANAIAEMRTYGESFIIADQSPNAVDIAAIRNTNTKIIMRLPDEADRRLLGKSAALKDEQLEEIARLPKGVAVVYQNDWLEPVLCRIQKFEGKESEYRYQPDTSAPPYKRADFNLEMLKFLLARRAPLDAPNLSIIEWGLKTLPLTTQCRIELYRALKACKDDSFELWTRFDRLSTLVVDLLGCRDAVREASKQARDNADFTLRLRSLLSFGSQALELAACQCLVKDLNLYQTELERVYASWVEEVKSTIEKPVINQGSVQ
ncbi:DNA helicase HerA, contains HAS-barrel and ATPase domains, partial [Azotobacter beijerinckii]